MMDPKIEDLKHKELSEKIIKAFYRVYNVLGYGFLEKVYVAALMMELVKMGLRARTEIPIHVFYDDHIIGEYAADILVEECIILEIKAAKILTIDHEAQLLNYLKATKIEVGLLMNFGPKPEVKRRVFSSDKR
jgi:GxxExxY protein